MLPASPEPRNGDALTGRGATYWSALGRCGMVSDNIAPIFHGFPVRKPARNATTHPRQLDADSAHTWRKQLEYTSWALLPAAGGAGFLGNVPLVVAGWTFGLAGITVPRLLDSLKRRTEKRPPSP